MNDFGKINTPDFRTWAENIILAARENGTAQEEIEQALEQAFGQGYSLGLNKGWAIEQDNDINKCNSDYDRFCI